MKKLLFLLVLVTGFSVSHAQTAESRPFLMGFTPFPYDISVEAVTYTYDRLAEDADLIAQHFDNGVPWTEALADQPYNPHVLDDWSFRRALTPASHQLLVTVTPISINRDGLAPYRGSGDDMPLPAPFNSYSFDHPDVIAAFLQYCDTIIAYFQPDYFMFGIEVNLLMKLAPDQWEAYMRLHRATYTHLKATYPDLPAFVSLTGVDLIEGYTDSDHANQVRALNDVLPYTDIVGLSVYPYMTAYMTNAIPTDLFDQIAALTGSALADHGLDAKPLAVAETGYPAQDFGIYVSADLRVEFDSDEEKQAAWTRYLLDSAAEYQFEFVINFVLRDYDAVWRALGSHEDLTIAWRDTGFYDENGIERPALSLWRTWLELPYD